VFANRKNQLLNFIPQETAKVSGAISSRRKLEPSWGMY